MGAGPGSGAPGEREDHQAASGHGDDRGAQRIRARRKQPAARTQRARGIHRVPVAQLRQIDHRLARRSREGAGRSGWRHSTRSTISRTTRCWRSAASWTKRRRCNGWRRRWAGSRVRRANWTRLTPWSPRRTAMRYVELRRVGEGQEVILAYHTPAAGHPDAAALAGAGRRDERRRRRARRPRRRGRRHGRLTKALVDNKKAESAQYARGAVARSRPAAGVGHVEQRSVASKKCARSSARPLKGIVSEPPTKEEVDRVKTRMARGLEQQLTDAQQVAMAMTTPVVAGRLAADVPAARPHTDRSRPKTWCAWPRLTSRIPT